MPESRVLKITEENLARQVQLKEETAQASKASRAAAAAAKNESQGGGGRSQGGGNGQQGAEATAAERNRKRIKETVDREEEYLRKQEVKIPIPDNLKVQLVDDWQFVTKRQQVNCLLYR